MERFRMDNTEGYTQQQLNDLNRLFEAETEAAGIFNPDAECFNDKTVMDAFAERVLREFDDAG